MQVYVYASGGYFVGVGSGTLLSDALAGSAHLTVQLDHLQHGFLSSMTQVVEQAVVLLGQPVQHAEHVATAA